MLQTRSLIHRSTILAFALLLMGASPGSCRQDVPDEPADAGSPDGSSTPAPLPEPPLDEQAMPCAIWGFAGREPYEHGHYGEDGGDGHHRDGDHDRDRDGGRGGRGHEADH